MNLKETRIIFLDPRIIKLGETETTESERYRLLLLSESIRENGLILPITVRKTGRDYTAVCGEKRIKAAILAGVKKIPCILGCSVDPELYRAVENFGRHNEDPFFPAEKLSALVKKYSADKLACALAISTKELLRVLAVKDLSEEIKEKIRKADIMYYLYERLCLLEKQEQENLIEKITMTIKGEDKKEPEMPKKTRHEPIINDKRFFINSIRKTADAMKQSGIDAELSQSETSKAIEIKLRIKKTAEDELQLSLLPNETA